MARLLNSGLLNPELLRIRAQAYQAWFDAWWDKVPHCQLGRDGLRSHLTWYWP